MQSKTEYKSTPQDQLSGLEEEFDISHDDIEKAFQDFVKDEKHERKTKDKGLVNTLSVFGGVMLVVATMMVLQLLGLEIGPDISFTRHIIGPSLIALMVLLFWTGIRKGSKSKDRRNNADLKLKVKPERAGKERSASGSETSYDAYAFTKKKQLRRSRKDKKFLGVCGGIASYFGFDPTIVRILFGLSMAFYGTPILIYFLLALVMKKEPREKD